MRTEWTRLHTGDGYPLFGLGHGLQQTGVAVLYVHGLRGNGFTLFTDDLSVALPAAGYPFVRGNLRAAELLRIDEFPESVQVHKGGGAFHTFDDSMQDIAAWMDYIESRGHRHVVLFGHSLGSLKATHYLARTADARVVGLVLASTADLIAMHESRFTFEERAQFADLAAALVAAGYGDELLPPECGMGLMRQPVSAASYFDRFGANPGWDVMDLYGRGSTRAFAALRRVQVPLLAMFGSENETVPASRTGQVFEVLCDAAAQAPSFTTAVLAGANHFFTGHGEQVASVLLNWLAQQPIWRAA